MNRPISLRSKFAAMFYPAAMIAVSVSVSVAVASRSEAQVGRAIWFEVVEFEVGVPASDSLGHIHLGTETLTNNTSVQISWGDGPLPTRPSWVESPT